MIAAGIDEAGYGPLLGPLVVALTAFRDATPNRGLWHALQAAVRRNPTGASSRLPVADSKRLYQSGAGLAALETTALAFSAWNVGGDLPADGAAFLARHVTDTLPPTHRYPWYRCGLTSLRLPLAADADAVRRAADRLRTVGARAGVELLHIAVAPLLEAEFSQRAERCASKARVLFELNVDLIDGLRALHDGPLHVLCDRHGGRNRYQELLAQAYPMQGVRVESEQRGRSRYALGSGPRAMVVSYEVGGEQKGMEVALASIFAKYTRELFIECLNRHFATRAASVRRTAGYYSDGQRFLDDLTAAGVLTADELRLLVRSR